jgi:nucleolar pre-ribosomal-associated protein 1
MRNKPDPFASVSSTISVLAQAAPVILRLSLIPGTSIPQLPSLVIQAVDSLRCLEGSIGNHTFPSKTAIHDGKRSSPPHTAHTLHDNHVEKYAVQVWGEVIEALWRVTMSLEDKPSTWGKLTCRLLVWRSMVGAEGSEIGEWARKEVVRNLMTPRG